MCFLYINLPYYNKDRLACMSKFLFEIQQKNRIEQRGILKRYSTDCYGKQPTLETMRSEKAEKYTELNRGSKEYEMWFLKYVPDKNKPLSEYGKSLSKKFKNESIEIDSKSSVSSSKQEIEKDNEQVPNVEITKTIRRHKNRKATKKTATFMDLFRSRRRTQKL